MPTEHFEDLENIYNEKIKDAQKGIMFNENIKVGKTPKDTFPGPDQVGKKLFDDNGPEIADGYKPVEVDPIKNRVKSTYNETELSQNVSPQKKRQKGVKKESAKINNSTMKEHTNKSSFDRLFEDVMGDDGFSQFSGGGDEGAEMNGEPEGDSEFGDMEEDVVTLELDREVAQKLYDLLDVEFGGEDLGEEEPSVEELPAEDEVSAESHVDIKPQPDAVTKLATKNGGNNKVGGDANPAGGSAQNNAGGQEDGGKPKVQPDSVSKLTGMGNKVGGKVTGGNKHLFKA